jgi:hypothetical protein
MVTKNYMLKKPQGPSAPKLFLDQQVVPALIDAAGAVEGVLETIAVRSRAAPFSALGAALGTGALLSMVLLSRRA